MTQGICDMLNLPHLEDVLKNEKDVRDEALPEQESEEISQDSIDAIERAGKALAAQSNASDQRQAKDHADAMDELHQETQRHGQDLMDLGFNVDPRSSARIFEVAAMMYKNAIDAKNSKRDMQLRLMKMMLEKRKLDIMEGQRTSEAPTISGEGVIIEDRNELIRRLREQQAQMATMKPK